MSTDYIFEDSIYYLTLFFSEIMPETSDRTSPRQTDAPGHTGAASTCRKRESEASLALTAKALEFYLGSKPTPEVLAGLKRTPEGKPYFPDYSDFHYNISHSGRYAVCGMICGGTEPQPVGIDLQEIPSDSGKALRIADHFFSDSEKESLHSLVDRGDVSTALLLFCRYWTARESYIKLTGRGLAEPFGSYDPDLEHGRIVVPGSDRQVYLTECEAPDGYRLSICSYIPLAKIARQYVGHSLNL